MMNTSGNYSGCQPLTNYIFFSIFLTFLIFFGIVLNSISLWIFWFRVKQWNSTVVLQFNLAISDAIITPAAPLLIVDSFTEGWTFGTFLCQCEIFLLHIHTYGSIYFLTLISIHRYFTVVQKAKRTAWTRKPFITKLCIGVWGCLLLQGISAFIFVKTSKVHGITQCFTFQQTETEQAVYYFLGIWFILFTGALIPFSITLVCYSLLSRYILKVNPMSTLSKAMVSKSVQTIFVSLIIFIICYVPVHITRTAVVTITLFFPAFCSLLNRFEAAYHITWLLSEINCLIDPILYCFASARFTYTFTGWCGILCSRGNDQRCSSDEALGDQVDSASGKAHRGPLPAVGMKEMGIVLSDRCEK